MKILCLMVKAPKSQSVSIERQEYYCGFFWEAVPYYRLEAGVCAGSGIYYAGGEKVHQYNVFSVNTPAQYAIAELLQNPDSYTGLSGFFQEKRDLLAKGLSEIGFDVLIPEATYFCLLLIKSFQIREIWNLLNG